MSENNVENTSFKIDDVSEEKSQFEIDNERRAQLDKERLEKEHSQESAEKGNVVQEIQDEEREQGQEQVQEEEVVHEEQPPIQISHKTQIVDNFFDGPPPVRNTPSQNQQTQSANTQGGNVQKNTKQQQNTADENSSTQEQSQNTSQNLQNNTNVQEKKTNVSNNQHVQEAETEIKVEAAQPLPPIKVPKHNTVIVDNNLDMPRKKPAETNANKAQQNTANNTKPQEQSQNVADTNQKVQAQKQVQDTATVKNAQNNAQQSQVNSQSQQAEVQATPPPIKLPKHNTVIVDNNLDMPRKKVSPANAEGNKANTSENVQNKTDNNVKSETQNVSKQKNTADSVSSQQNPLNAQGAQASTNEVNAEEKIETPPPIKLPKHNSVIVDNNLDMPRKKVSPANTEGNKANASENVQNKTDNNVKSDTQNVSKQKNTANSISSQQNSSNAQGAQASANEVKIEEKAETPPPIKLPKHNTVIVDNNLDMPKKKATVEKTDTKAETAVDNHQNTTNNKKAQDQSQNVANADQNVQEQAQKQVQNVQEQSQKQAQDKVKVQNTQNNAKQSQVNTQSQQAEAQAVPPPIKLPKRETVIVDNNLDIESGKKNKKNKKAEKNAGKNAANNKNVVKEAEAKTAQQTATNDNKLNKEAKTSELKVVETEKTLQNKAVETKGAKADIKQKEDNIQNKAKDQDVNAKVIVENAITQVEKPIFEELDKKVPSFNERDESNHIRRSQVTPQSTSDIMSLISSDMYAGFWIRCVAFVIDASFVVCLMNIAVYFDIESYIPISIAIVYMILFAFYSFIFVYLFDGQSIGKMLTGIKVIEENGSKLGFFTAFVREFAGKLIMIPLFLTFIFTAFSYKKHSIIDYLSDTCVIKSKYQSLYDELMTDTEEN